MHENKRPMWRVLNCGKAFEDVMDWEKELAGASLTLSETEQKSECAKYFYRPLVEPTPENLLACERGNELPAEEAIYPWDYAKHMTASGISKIRSGYCVLPDGIGYSVMRVEMKGVTDEIMQVFLDHFHPEGDLFYKCWYPVMHVRHYSNAAIENVGRGMEMLHFIDGLNEERLGITEDMDDPDPELIGIDGGVVYVEPLHQPGKNRMYVIEACYYRETPEGRETILHFWSGLTKKDGKYVRMIPEGEQVNVEDVRALFEHSIWENTQLGELIRQFGEDWLRK